MRSWPTLTSVVLIARLRGRTGTRNRGFESTFVVLDVHTPARTCPDVVGVEAAHHPAVEVQADGPGPLRRHAGDVNVVGVRYEARDRAASEQDDAAARELNAVVIDSTVWRQPHVVALLEHSFQHRDHAP